MHKPIIIGRVVEKYGWQVTNAVSKTNGQTSANGNAVKTGNTYDIRLYDGQGNLLRQTSAKDGTVQFNVSNLPDGIYYLHIYDGVSANPEIHQVVVEK